MPSPGNHPHATCPECGASVPMVRERWLHVHSVGSAEYAYPRGDRRRCPGSLMLPRELAPDAGERTPGTGGLGQALEPLDPRSDGPPRSGGGP